MSRFHGRQHRGALAEHRRKLHAEAEQRNQLTVIERHRWWRQPDRPTATTEEEEEETDR